MTRAPGAILVLAIALAVSACAQSGPKVTTGARPGPQLHAVARPGHPRAIHYRPEGLTLYAPRPGYRPSISRRDVLGLYHRWPAGLKLKGTPTIQLKTVNDGNPNPKALDYPGWVVTFQHTKPTSYGPASVSQKADCAWVSVYDLRTRVWTENFQNCPDRPVKKPSCDSGCTPANQTALDAAANYAEGVAGAAHVFAGVAVDDAANKVVVHLVHAPQSILGELRARHPGIYAIHNDAPRTLSAVMKIERALDFATLRSKGIDLVSAGPTQDGYLTVGVSSKVAKAQTFFDSKYGRGIIRVVHAEPATFGDGGPVLKHPIEGVVAVRSTRSQQANAAEVRQWQKRPIAVFTNGNESVLRFVLPGNGCMPRATSAAVEGKILMLVMRRGSRCTLVGRFYEVTVSLAKPVLGQGLRSVVARYGDSGKGRRMRLTELVYG